MKIPRNVDGLHLVKALRVLDYRVDRQKGSHLRITTQQDGENHEVVRLVPIIMRSKPELFPGSSNASPPITD